MPTKHKQMQHLIREWKKTTGNIEINLAEVARFAISRGWPLPAPISPEEKLAREFAQAAREETRKDSKTGHPYRVYHAYHPDGGGQGMLWIDIDEAPRKHMEKSAILRREQVVGDLLQLTLDLDHWNRVNHSQQPIDIPLDFTDDIDWRKNSGGEEKAA